MTEPDVALTDFFLAAECATFFVLLLRAHDLKRLLHVGGLLLFASLALGSLFGGITHGFFSDETQVGFHVMWRLTTLTVGVTALSCWWLASALGPPKLEKPLATFGVVAFLAYAVFTLSGTRTFFAVIVNYVPAILVLLAFLGLRALQGSRPARVAALGVVATLVASVLQQMKVAIHPVYFNHNALYHLIDACAFYVFYRAFVLKIRAVRAEAGSLEPSEFPLPRKTQGRPN